MKSQEGDIRKNHHFPGHVAGLDQLVFGIGKYLFLKWCPGIAINSKLNLVQA